MYAIPDLHSKQLHHEGAGCLDAVPELGGGLSWQDADLSAGYARQLGNLPVESFREEGLKVTCLGVEVHPLQGQHQLSLQTQLRKS